MKVMANGPAWARSTFYTAIGALIGSGAPLGYLLLRAALERRFPAPRFVRRELGRQPLVYAYLGAGTTTVLATFGLLLGRLEDARQRTQRERDRLRNEFTTLVTHDLRDPLQVILLEAQMLLERADGEEVHAPTAALRRIEGTVQRLAQVADDFQDAIQIDSGYVPLQLRPVAVPEAAAALLARLRPRLQPHPLALSVDGQPRPVLADPARLDEIMRNLLENAAKYSWERAPIRVEVREGGGGQTVIAVQDEGVGITAQDMPYLFDREVQARRARERKSGLGVGLYITKGLVEAHGGHIRVRSVPGSGSTFEVLLPTTRALPGEAAPLPVPKGAARPGTVRAYMHADPPTIGRDQTLAEARAAMRDRGVRCLPVLEGEVPAGVICDRDLVIAGPEEGAAREATAVGDVMARYPFVVGPDAPVEQVARIMVEQRHDVAVVVEAGRLVGLLDAPALLRALAGLPPAPAHPAPPPAV